MTTGDSEQRSFTPKWLREQVRSISHRMKRTPFSLPLFIILFPKGQPLLLSAFVFPSVWMENTADERTWPVI